MATPEEARIWEGLDYKSAMPRLLILGESRYDEDFSDRDVIEYRLAGKFKRGQRRTFTKFERWVLGPQCVEEDALKFWYRTAFYNYNRTFYPGKPRIPLNYPTRTSSENITFSYKTLEHLKPTHVIVWGKANWDSLNVGSPWIADETIPGTNEPFCSTITEGQTILFARVYHPSTRFSPKDSSHMLSQFLKIPPR